MFVQVAELDVPFKFGRSLVPSRFPVLTPDHGYAKRCRITESVLRAAVALTTFDGRRQDLSTKVAYTKAPLGVLS